VAPEVVAAEVWGGTPAADAVEDDERSPQPKDMMATATMANPATILLCIEVTWGRGTEVLRRG
jgi:hypothetical protein